MVSFLWFSILQYSTYLVYILWFVVIQVEWVVKMIDYMGINNLMVSWSS